MSYAETEREQNRIKMMREILHTLTKIAEDLDKIAPYFEERTISCAPLKQKEKE